MEGIKCTGKRDKLVDCLRGYACLLVVFGHVIMGIRKWGGIPTFEYPLEKFIWTFHVSLFFFLSGYNVKLLKSGNQKEPEQGLSRISLSKLQYHIFQYQYFTF